ncbi:hypothetical protein PV396_36370 [Streptomyces sp. ME02-8801-2C]|uniref:hypothetical protein n=1 Tax=Streptomyces sp. ME02-8801-2C TaxID=3028680 RepID=UPI0029A47B1B|nr:hypothetical protein [Streptomyces sp. ME02-8801-2C]MDX3457371.1 hypothetical protein [Streptomyces sp. ME02-8801-2C]
MRGARLPPLFLALLTAVVLTASGCSGPGSGSSSEKATRSTHSATASKADGGCRPAVERGSLPVWARKGYLDGPQRHMIGEKGEIAAVLFGYPYHAPAAKDRANKILWVAKDAEGAAEMGPDDRLTIAATLAGTHEVVTRSVAGGPGPSLIDMPKPGCWTFSLSWPGHSDSVDVEYLAG